jgi:prepilin signal peptidase PulO-like enzyme (type II secretory pathway)
MTGHSRLDRPSRLARRRGPIPPARLGILFAVFLAILIYQRDYVLLALAGLGLIVYGFLIRSLK